MIRKKSDKSQMRKILQKYLTITPQNYWSHEKQSMRNSQAEKLKETYLNISWYTGRNAQKEKRLGKH